MKRFSVSVLSILLLYAGVAWALEACLHDDAHSDHASPRYRDDSHVMVDHEHSKDPSIPVIHCASLTHEVGPALRMASAEVARPDKGFALHKLSFSSAVSATLRNELWLEAVFRRIITISLPIDLARHLYLSVLQI